MGCWSACAAPRPCSARHADPLARCPGGGMLSLCEGAAREISLLLSMLAGTLLLAGRVPPGSRASPYPARCVAPRAGAASPARLTARAELPGDHPPCSAVTQKAGGCRSPPVGAAPAFPRASLQRLSRSPPTLRRRACPFPRECDLLMIAEPGGGGVWAAGAWRSPPRRGKMRHPHAGGEHGPCGAHHLGPLSFLLAPLTRGMTASSVVPGGGSLHLS